MSTKPSFNLLELQEPFGRILSDEDFGALTNDIAELIYLGQLNRRNLEDLLMEHGVNDITKIKAPALDMIICYINLIMYDNHITTNEACRWVKVRACIHIGLTSQKAIAQWSA